MEIFLEVLKPAFPVFLLFALVGTFYILFNFYRRAVVKASAGVKRVEGEAGKSLASESFRISEQARSKGIIGEEGVSRVLEDLAEEFGLSVLHDLSIPGTNANIDHILIQSRVVFVIDAKNYLGQVNIKKDSQGNLQLYVGRYKRTEIAVKLKSYAQKIEESLNAEGILIKVVPLLAFYKANFHSDSKYQINGVMVNVSGVKNELLRFGSRKGKDFDTHLVAEKILKNFPFKD